MLLLVLVLAVLVGCTPDWSMYRADSSGTAGNPYETEISVDTLKTLHQVWSVPDVQSFAFADPPLVAGGAVFYSQSANDPTTGAITKSVIASYDVATGKERWSMTVPGNEQVIGATLGLLLVSDERDFPNSVTVRAFDEQTGSPRWAWRATNPTYGAGGSVLSAAGHLFVPANTGVFAIDPTTGRSLFQITCTLADGINCPFDVGRGVAADATHFYAGGFVEGGEEFDAATGRRLATFSTVRGQQVVEPMVVGPRVFSEGQLSNMAGPASGDVAAFSNTPCAAPVCPPQWVTLLSEPARSLAYESGRIFVRGIGSLVEALDPATGAVLWKGTTPAQGESDISVAGDVVYASSGGNLYAFPAAGCTARLGCQPVWHLSIDRTFDSPPIVTGGRMIYQDNEGLHALAAS